MDRRGILYSVWGESHDRYLDRSIASVRRWHPTLPIHIRRRPEGDLLDKAAMFGFTRFETTLFLDADTVVLGDLDFAFQQADHHGVACCICEQPWARRYPSLSGDSVEYNTGVLAFSQKAKPVFDEWQENARLIDSSIRFRDGGDIATMPCNDQAGFALATKKLKFNPFVLPMNWNFRPTWHKSWWGPIRIWHDYRDVPQSLLEWNAGQMQPDAVIAYAQLP